MKSILRIEETLTMGYKYFCGVDEFYESTQRELYQSGRIAIAKYQRLDGLN